RHLLRHVLFGHVYLLVAPFVVPGNPNAIVMVIPMIAIATPTTMVVVIPITRIRPIRTVAIVGGVVVAIVAAIRDQYSRWIMIVVVFEYSLVVVIGAFKRRSRHWRRSF